MKPKPPLWVAMHEAGHAVAMLANYPPPRIDYVSIIDQPETQLGIVQNEYRFQPARVEAMGDLGNMRPTFAHLAWLDVVEVLAGPVAEWRFRRRASHGARAFHARDMAKVIADLNVVLTPGEDAERVRVRLLWRDPTNVEAEACRAFDEADALVSRYWKRVAELGRWLHRVGRIEDDDLNAWWG